MNATIKIPTYYKSTSHIDEFYHALKHTPCPNCQRIGALIKNGILQGPKPDSSYTVKPPRGQRFFCSNRNQRQGCGHSFTIFYMQSIKGLTAFVSTVWAFLTALITTTTMMIPIALKRSQVDISVSTAYRWKRLLCNAQTAIRSALSTRIPPPSLSCVNPLTQTIQHLKKFFKNDSNPIAAYQAYFQQSFI